jgi:thiamine-monophosphate kinase
MTLAVTTDMLVAGVHFLPETGPFSLGWKTLAVNLSDLAALGARPRWVFLALSLPRADETWLAGFAEGFHVCARTFGVDLAGGDTTRGPLNLCVSAIGEVPAEEALRRDRAQAGDDIWLSGFPGLAALGLMHLQGRVVLPPAVRDLAIKRLEAPEPRVRLGQAIRPFAHAAIDISDGLLADLGHIAEASGLGAHLPLHTLPRLPEGVPRAVALEALLCGGDDYELCFTASPEQRSRIAQFASELDLPLWRIGHFTAKAPAHPAVRLLDPDGNDIPHTMQGYDHFVSCGRQGHEIPDR